MGEIGEGNKEIQNEKGENNEERGKGRNGVEQRQDKIRRKEIENSLNKWRKERGEERKRFKVINRKGIERKEG